MIKYVLWLGKIEAVDIEREARMLHVTKKCVWLKNDHHPHKNGWLKYYDTEVEAYWAYHDELSAEADKARRKLEDTLEELDAAEAALKKARVESLP